MITCNRSFFAVVVSLAIAFAVSPHRLHATELPVQIKSFDGFTLDGMLALPSGIPATKVTRVIVLIHGSGRSDMNSDLSAVAKDGKTKILLFKDLSDALTKKGFAVLRFHKRNHQLVVLNKQLRARGVKKPPPALLKQYRGFVANPLKTFVDDAKAVGAFAQRRFPTAGLYLLGVSEGTYVGLQVLNEMPSVKGVAMIGFFATTLETLVFEQYVYRNMYWFRRSDKNHDGKLDTTELRAAGPRGLNMLRQISAFDLNKNGALDDTEYRAASLFDWYKFPRIASYTIQTAKYPTVMQILKKTTAQIAFFQGLYDNQTPAYHAHSVQVLAKYLWKKQNFRFQFFPKLGHILHPQPRYDSVGYWPIDRKALTRIAVELGQQFR